MHDMDEVSEVLTLSEAAAYLRVHYETVRRWCRDGLLPTTRLGHTRRVRRQDLDRLWSTSGRAAAVEGEG
jgi:excisionase family DNA binding protein